MFFALVQEAQFMVSVRQNVFDERQNQLRWQVKHGDDPASTEYQLKVIEDRLEDWRIYKVRNPHTFFSQSVSGVLLSCWHVSPSVL